ncbi:MAG: M1 family metallopeptidase [Candidatus Lokiarchaeota archaeon]|nr:M1 family metallopeptidase [Candidatus Lokiarchaeota archaeon]
MEPVHYLLHLEPDLEKFVFLGTTQITILSDDTIGKVVLNGKFLNILSCKIKINEEYIACDFDYDENKEEIVVKFPQEISGNFEIKIHYKGELNDKLLGFYRSSYTIEGQEETKYIATTQFEERYARWAFPCFDQPRYKTPFDIEFVINENLTGISNCAVSEEIMLENGKKLVKFEQTPKMCTYLLYFGVGEFEYVEQKSENLTVRVYTTPGNSQYGELGLEISKKSIEILEELTGIPYPISKIDNIAVKDFQFGAMENYGAVTYREPLILVYPGKTSKSSRTQIVIVICHENSHMWFGNLVSPADWQYVWLNESFASYFERVVTDRIYPEWNIWDDFILDSTLGALTRDSLINTFPIELPGGKPIDINTATAPIIYDKGASIIRVLSDFLGEEKFKLGVKSFLDKYKFDIANTEQYWAAFEEATGEPIKKFADSWVHQKGYPFITAHKDGNILKLQQARFTYLPHETDTTWLIPISYTLFLSDGTQLDKKTVMEAATMEVELPENTVTYKLNTQQKGFYRVLYTDGNFEKLGELIVEKKLSHLDVFGIQNDIFSFTIRGDFSVDKYLDFLSKYYSQEDSYLSLRNISGNLNSLYFFMDSKRSRIAEIGRTMSDRYLEKIGLEPKEDDSLETSRIRNILLWSSFIFDSKLVKNFVKGKYDDFKKDTPIHADILSTMYRSFAAYDKNSKHLFFKKLMDPKTTGQELLYLCQAIGEVRSEQDLKEILDMVLDKMPLNVRYIPILVAAQNETTKPWLWNWYKEHAAILKEKLTPMNLGTVLVGLAFHSGLGREEDVGMVLEKLAQEMPDREDDINMALELLKVYSTVLFRN